MSDRISTPEGARSLGRRIADARKKLGISQDILGVEAGVERSLISKLEGGQFKTINGSVQKICTALGLNPSEVDGGEHLEAIFQRVSNLSRRAPHALTVIDAFLNVLESIDKHPT
ncbi:helix-turn-helix domain-containing protein [Pinirhizobacter soli]|uniref:helix-turn-helix domain-containing protein n=1 Tax=Pinirhizobacter soli TaxID=2786953 RepID=UPI003CE5A6D6